MSSHKQDTGRANWSKKEPSTLADVCSATLTENLGVSDGTRAFALVDWNSTADHSIDLAFWWIALIVDSECSNPKKNSGPGRFFLVGNGFIAYVLKGGRRSYDFSLLRAMVKLPRRYAPRQPRMG
jgi:hypothetical protein